jgi:hypothetical protein
MADCHTGGKSVMPEAPMRIRNAITLIAMLTAPVLAHAEAGPMQGGCKADIQSLCGSVQPGGGRIRDCMRQHRTELSAACKVAIADRMLERSGQRADQRTPGITQVSPKP